MTGPTPTSLQAAEGSSSADGWHDLEVANPSWLVEKLGAECDDLQGLRELTVNGLEAIQALSPGHGGRVVWDLDWDRYERSQGRERKLAVIDTGTGMTAEQMRHYINHLAASSREHGRTSNFGCGAKVACGSRNPCGLEYRSWYEGQGALVCFKRRPDGRWGLEPQSTSDGQSDFWRPLSEVDKPWLLRGRSHGTQVVLLGAQERQDTTQPPASVTEGRRQWISRYLTTRFLTFPADVEVLVRQQAGPRPDWGAPGPLQQLYGQRHHLEAHAQTGGVVELSDALAHWWVLDEPRSRRRDAATWTATGHAAAMLGEELYDLLAQTRGGYGRLQDFGVRFGYERVVIYIEYHGPGMLESNTARTLLLLDHQPLPWSRWGEEFASLMPQEILALQERVAGVDGTPRSEAISSRVAHLLPLYSLSEYRPPRPPANPSTEGRPSPSTNEGATSLSPAQDAPPGTVVDGRQQLIGYEPAGEGGDVAPSILPDLPDVAWISTRDGTRAPGDLEDQAARYHFARHELTINADFRAITDMIFYWHRRYEGTPGARLVIDAQVREWFEQVLVEVVLSARGSRWKEEQLAALLSPTSFSAALLPRQLVHAMLQKRLAQKLGAARD